MACLLLETDTHLNLADFGNLLEVVFDFVSLRCGIGTQQSRIDPRPQFSTLIARNRWRKQGFTPSFSQFSGGFPESRCFANEIGAPSAGGSNFGDAGERFN
jgi:hypothetical protein